MERRHFLLAAAAGLGGIGLLSSLSKKKEPVQCTGPDCERRINVNVDASKHRYPRQPYRAFRNADQELKSLGSTEQFGSSNLALDLPPELRTANWGGGSCVHASTVNLLIWQGRHEMAAWWRQTYSGGEYSTRLSQRMEHAGLRWAATGDGSMQFLDWCCRTRRGAGIGYFPRHAINIVGLDQRTAYLLDNNRTHTIIEVPRAQFERNWRGYGGWGWTLVYSPPPPDPRA